VITSNLWRGKRYAVLGLARSGAATVHALLASGAEVVAWDANEAAREAVVDTVQDLSHGLDNVSLKLAAPLTLDLTGFTAVVVSPGVPLNRHPIAGHAAKYGVPVIGDIELFAQARAELPPHKVVGITGTNGKSTTTALIHHTLKTAGVPTTMGGNIGLPILGQEPLPAGGVYVLELSSYQIDLTFTLDCDVAVLLNVTPDHLDRYASFEAYAASKARLFEMQSFENRVAIIGISESSLRRILPKFTWGAGQGHFPFDSGIDDSFGGFDAPALQGPHNVQNIWASECVRVALDVYRDVFVKALRTYPGLPHRMERIRELNGVLYVNDSKATNADSAAPALAAYPAIRWILGGQAKTAELDACVPHFGHVRSAYTIGEAGGMFADLLRPHMAVEESGTLAVAVAHAARDAVAGETVLLSPACASFDQFRNFEDRGDAFRQLVEAL
jgi:UDP-N-acetylmuramoylalanine--D-glutamate ligase